MGVVGGGASLIRCYGYLDIGRSEFNPRFPENHKQNTKRPVNQKRINITDTILDVKYLTARCIM